MPAATLSPQEWGASLNPKRETKSDRAEVRIFPSLKKKSEIFAALKNKTLSDWIVGLIEREVRKEERELDKKTKISR